MAFLVWKPVSVGDAQALSWDVTISEDLEFRVTPTEHPVEKGANITDHVRREPERVRLEIFISNQPIESPNLAIEGVELDIKEYEAPLAPTPGAIFGAVQNAIGSAINFLLGNKKNNKATIYMHNTPKDYVVDAFAKLHELQATGQLVDVYTSKWDFTDMILESWLPHRGAEEGGGATISLELRKIVTVETKAVNAPAPTEPRGKPAAAKGKQGPKTADEKKRSILSQLGVKAK